MESARIDAALNGLSMHMPRAPMKLVDDMIHTVNAFEAEKNRRLGPKAPEKAAEIAPEVMQRKANRSLGR